MPFNSKFKIKNFSIQDCKNAEVVDLSANRSYGRRFKLIVNGIESKEYKFKDILRQVRKLSKKMIDGEQDDKRANLKSLKTFVTNLKMAEGKAIKAYSKRDNCYKFRTWLHRLFDFGSHLKKLEKLDATIVENTNSRKEPALEKLLHYFETEKLIKRGEVNLQDQAGNTALMRACYLGHKEDVELLLTHQADLNIRNQAGNTALIFACQGGNKEIVELLLAHQPDLNIQGEAGFTALMLARGHKEIVKLLLTHQADLNIQNQAGNTARMDACHGGNKETVELLLAHQPPKLNIQNLTGATALMLACECGSEEIVELLLAYQPDLNIQSDMKDTAYTIAKLNKHKEIAEILGKALKPNELLIQKEMLKLKTLGHSTQLKGVSKVQLGEDHNSFSAALEGGHGSYMLRKLIKASTDFPLHSKVITDNESTHLINFLTSETGESNLKTLDLIEKGLPVLIATGYKGHHVSILLWGPYFILCNRGGASRRVAEVYQYDSKKLNANILNKIRGVRNRNRDAYKELFFNELPKILNFRESQGNFEKELERLNGNVLEKQTVGNCSWASTEEAAFNFFALFKLLANDQAQLKEPSTIDFQDEIDIKNKFYAWLVFMQTCQLEHYLSTYTLRPTQSLNKVNNALERRKAIKIDFAVVFAAIKEIKAKAMKTSESKEALKSLERILDESIFLRTNQEESFKSANNLVENIEAFCSSS